MAIVHANAQTFPQEVLQSNETVLVDFWAEWCGPCKMIAPVLDELAQTYEGKLKVVKLNVDENRATAIKYHVRSIPMLLLFKDGQMASMKVGAMPKGKIVEWLAEAGVGKAAA